MVIFRTQVNAASGQPGNHDARVLKNDSKLILSRHRRLASPISNLADGCPLV
jgi:hypothetical protein